MNGIEGRTSRTTAWIMSRALLLLTLLCAGAGADARIMTAATGTTSVTAVTGAERTSGRTTTQRAEVHLMRASADGRGNGALLSVPAMTADLMAERIDELALVTAMALDATPFAEARLTAPSTPFEARPSAGHVGYGLPLPEPDGWTAVAATVALALFFFLRRLS